jgi:hypothetical protein
VIFEGYQKDLAREQRAFLQRPRRDWDSHLAKTRAFLGQGMREADPSRPVLILGAGSGLEVPWAVAPQSTVAWDADPWSRIRTFLRHRRWAPWIFSDITGGLRDLDALLRRNVAQPWSGKRVRMEAATMRIAGLLPSLNPEPAELREFLRTQRPGTVLVANVIGQFGVVAQRCVERAFGSKSPWLDDPDIVDPLAEALDAWTAKAVEAVLRAIGESGANLWMVHDRATFEGEADLVLKSFSPRWQDQVGGKGILNAADALCGLEVSEVLGRTPDHWERWFWPLGEDQVHLMEAMTFGPGGASTVPSV